MFWSEKGWTIFEIWGYEQRVIANNGITTEDFDELCRAIGFDSKTTESIKLEFENMGLFVDSYEQQESYHR